MARTVTLQPNDDKTFDIDLSNELKRSDEVINGITSFTDDQAVNLTYTNPLVIGVKMVRVTVGGAVDGTTYKVSLVVVTSYSPAIEVEFFVIGADT